MENQSLVSLMAFYLQGGVIMVQLIPDEYLHKKGLTRGDVNKMSVEEYNKFSLDYAMSRPEASLPVGETYDTDAIRPSREERLLAYSYRK